MKCEYCKKEHDGSYGSGRFCIETCARGYSTNAKRKEINEKISKTLKSKYVKPEYVLICKKCGKEFITTNKDRVLCSLKCHHTKTVYGTVFMKSKYSNTSNGYVKVYLSNGKVVEEHRFVMENQIGRKLEYNEIIHHKDGNKQNNVIDNLEIISRSDHSSYHAPCAKKMILICTYCNQEFERSLSQVKAKIKKGQTDFYCSRSCASKHFGRGRPK